MKRVRAIGLGFLLAGAATACAPVMETHGYTPISEALARIEVGVDTRSSVQTKIGRPASTGAFDEDGWYYVSSVVEHYTFYEPKVVERTVVAVSFDDAGVVRDVQRFGLDDGRVIDLETRTTPTYGRQLTIVEQIVSNLGAVTGADVFAE